MPKVVLLRSKSIGGIEPRLDKEARSLARAGYDVHAVLWDREAAYAPVEIRHGTTIHRIALRAPTNAPSLLWKSAWWRRKAYGLVERLQPDVVHAADLDTVSIALRAKRELGAKVVFDVWDCYGEMITRRIPRAARVLLCRREAVAAQQSDLLVLPDARRREHPGFSNVPSVEVMNVPEDGFAVRDPNPFLTVFYGGTLSEDRGIPSLIRAACEAGGALDIAGDGPLRKRMEVLIGDHCACYLGVLPYDHVLQWMQKAWVIPVLYDPKVRNNRHAAPNRLYEALMLSKPVVVSEGCGVDRLVEEEGVGLVVPYGDDSALRAALLRLKDSPQECAEMGARGRRLYENRFNWRVMEKRLIEAYSKL